MFRTTRGRRLRVENLERRALLAGDVAVAVVDGHLMIEGDELDNAIELTAGLATGSVLVTGVATAGGDTTLSFEGATGTSFEVPGVTGDVVVRLHAGADALTAGALAVADDLKIWMGLDDDDVSLEADLTVAGDLKIDTDGGDDVVAAVGTTVDGHAQIKTGNGDDDVSLVDMVVGAEQENGEAMAAAQNPNGRGGPLGGLLGFLFGNGNGPGNSNAHSHHAVGLSVDTGNGDDVVSIDGLTAAKLKVDTGNGDDSFVLAGAIVDRIHFDLGRGDDTASVATTMTDHLKAELGHGDDELVIDASVDIALSLFMDGGRGTDTLASGLPGNVPLDLVRRGFESIL